MKSYKAQLDEFESAMKAIYELLNAQRGDGKNCPAWLNQAFWIARNALLRQ